mmetsp:Transcript_56843/g.166408  ORF Transcript_56843/g.166408 Transcript_56843/m.166408 type:complete len:245 (+) Transcript_56843:226-960(+)
MAALSSARVMGTEPAQRASPGDLVSSCPSCSPAMVASSSATKPAPMSSTPWPTSSWGPGRWNAVLGNGGLPSIRPLSSSVNSAVSPWDAPFPSSVKAYASSWCSHADASSSLTAGLPSRKSTSPGSEVPFDLCERPGVMLPVLARALPPSCSSRSSENGRSPWIGVSLRGTSLCAPASALRALPAATATMEALLCWLPCPNCSLRCSASTPGTPEPSFLGVEALCVLLPPPTREGGCGTSPEYG